MPSRDLPFGQPTPAEVRGIVRAMDDALLEAVKFFWEVTPESPDFEATIAKAMASGFIRPKGRIDGKWGLNEEPHEYVWSERDDSLALKTLVVTDRDGTETMVVDPYVFYHGEGLREERIKLLLKRGGGIIELPWNRIKDVRIEGPIEGSNSLRAQVALSNGESVDVQMIAGAVIGGTELGTYRGLLKELVRLVPTLRG